MPTVLIVDDEDRFRTSLTRRLKMRGYDTLDVDNGEDAIKLIRSRNDIDVVILDRKMPKLAGEQALKEMKVFRPELQVIMLTGHGSMESAMESGRLEAYAYLQKPYGIEELIEVIDAARQDKITLMQRHEIPQVEKGSAWKWLVGSHNSRPGVILLGLLIFFAITLAPPPERLLELVSSEKTGRLSDPHVGYAGYAKMHMGESIAKYYGRTFRLGEAAVNEHGEKVIKRLDARARRLEGQGDAGGAAGCRALLGYRCNPGGSDGHAGRGAHVLHAGPATRRHRQGLRQGRGHLHLRRSRHGPGNQPDRPRSTHRPAASRPCQESDHDCCSSSSPCSPWPAPSFPSTR